MKAPLILVISEKMNSNRKTDRNEHGLIRMGQKARHNLGLESQNTVELWPNNNNDQDRINRSKVLEIFKAFSSDLKKAKEDMPEDDYARVGFVTSKTFAYICKDQPNKKSNIWVADSIEDTFIGGDPEFVLFTDEGSIQYAAEVLDHYSDFGSDGPLAELRPEPAVEVKDFVNRMRKMLKDHPSSNRVKNFQWKSGCVYTAVRHGLGTSRDWPVGGHVHIGTPLKLSKKIESLNNEYKEDMFQEAIFACLNKALDEMVAIPLIKIDGKDKTVQRRSGMDRYGAFGDLRTDHDRLEYRTISGEWLSHPRLATAVLGTIKAIAHSFFALVEDHDFAEQLILTNSQLKTFNNLECFHTSKCFSRDFDGWKDIQIMKDLRTILGSSRMMDILHSAKIGFGKSYYSDLNEMLRSLPIYSQYSEYIDLFLEIVALPYKAFREMNRNLKETWVEGSDFIV